MHIICELEVFRKEFFVCVKICIIDETIFFYERCFRRGSHRYTFFSIRYILLHFWYVPEYMQ